MPLIRTHSLGINWNGWIVTPTTDVFGFEAIDLDLGPGVAAAASSSDSSSLSRRGGIASTANSPPGYNSTST